MVTETPGETAAQARDVARLRKLREAGLSHAGRR
jgi:hypothetical protein